MKKWIALLMVSLLMGPAFAEEASTTSEAPAATTHESAPAHEATTSNGMSAENPATSEESKAEAPASSGGMSDTIKTYWNKFIDVFTGPPSSK